MNRGKIWRLQLTKDEHATDTVRKFKSKKTRLLISSPYIK